MFFFKNRNFYSISSLSQTFLGGLCTHDNVIANKPTLNSLKFFTISRIRARVCKYLIPLYLVSFLLMRCIHTNIHTIDISYTLVSASAYQKWSKKSQRFPLITIVGGHIGRSHSSKNAKENTILFCICVLNTF